MGPEAEQPAPSLPALSAQPVGLGTLLAERALRMRRTQAVVPQAEQGGEWGVAGPLGPEEVRR